MDCHEYQLDSSARRQAVRDSGGASVRARRTHGGDETSPDRQPDLEADTGWTSAASDAARAPAFRCLGSVLLVVLITSGGPGCSREGGSDGGAPAAAGESGVPWTALEPQRAASVSPIGEGREADSASTFVPATCGFNGATSNECREADSASTFVGGTAPDRHPTLWFGPARSDREEPAGFSDWRRTERQAARATATVVVTNTADSGAGSLRQALIDANTTLAADVISFNIPGSGPHVIQPQTPLPAITNRVTLDGCTQPETGCTSWPLTLQIEIDFSVAGRGFFVAAGSSTIRGLSLYGTTYTTTLDPAEAIGLYTRGGNIIQSNHLGVRADGVTVVQNSYAVLITDLSASNLIGSNGDGNRDAAEANLISGNFGALYITGSGGGHTLSGNVIGVGPAADTCLQNALPGIYIESDTGNNLILDNVIGCNAVAGILLKYVNGDVLTGNLIGTDPSQTQVLGNYGPGIWLDNTSKVQVGVMGDAPNVLAHNLTSGILLDASLGTSNRITRISAFDNALLGIDLYPSAGPNRNDVGDADSGVNELQNHPEIGPHVYEDGQLTIQYRVLSAPEHTVYPLTIEFYLADDSGEEGLTWLGNASYLEADAQRLVSTSFVPAFPVEADARIVATATDRNGNTSEFTSSDADEDGYSYTGDCNDADPTVHPGASEQPGDEIDQDCDGRELCYFDSDDDQVRPTGSATFSSADADCGDSGEAVEGDPEGDCDDASSSIYPGALESCDSIDSDCDGSFVDESPDNDTDNLPDCTDPDDDNDGILDPNDNCPLLQNPSQQDTDQNGVGDACDQDQDGDLFADSIDNCPAIKNPDQSNIDGDDLGDVCDPDADGDEIETPHDCDDRDSSVSRPINYCGDLDRDGFGDPEDTFEVCSSLAPLGYVANCDDNCTQVSNPDQGNLDGDDRGDLCDPDADGDGVGAGEDCNDMDGSVEAVRTWYRDADEDGWGDPGDPLDACSVAPPPGFAATNTDNCPDDFNPDQVDLDHDGTGDLCDTDQDGDGIEADSDCDDRDADVAALNTWYYDLDRDGFGDPSDPLVLCSTSAPSGYVSDGTDNCPGISNEDQADLDADGKGDVCDDDADGDGADIDRDCDDFDPGVGGPTTFYFDGDQDGIGTEAPTLSLCSTAPPAGYAIDSGDNCPTVANPDQVDADGDGVGAACDSDDQPTTPSPLPSPTPTLTPSPSPTPEDTPTPTPLPTETPLPSPTPEVLPTETPITPSPTGSPTPDSTPSPAATSPDVTPTPLEEGSVTGAGCACSVPSDRTPDGSLALLLLSLSWTGLARHRRRSLNRL